MPVPPHGERVEATEVSPRRLLRGVWPNLPALLCASVAVCLAATVPVLVAPGVNPVAVALYALLVAPAATALADTVTGIGGTGRATVPGFATRLVRLWPFAVRQALVPAAATVLLLAALRVWTATGSPLLLPSVALTGAASVLAVPAAMAALVLGAARPALRGRRLWVTALHLVARRPVRFAAALCVVVLGVWAAASWSASLLLLLPAPAAIVAVAAVWTTAAEVRPARH
ncbi:hypothetical protein Athai_26220 [Actinocatenispora thailandica]|uniref:DUF624 domain-containing protein n=1 Tax=Actinocatenispora thailandica TaxID=227318 RepID=A0A7R7HXI7_9ACTN|nr:hypothetical protein [Actinocatenispora thailandica]BCJ35119.1 hypothetical protein Athai_26220 [Actinocatenispora thailandica]